ncbi:hypothetical protein F5B17DRAFT_406413 [Nemania serpens]|nr:hypothetical protein F5B17DRAFT_406413 [Nemania serpens]
MSERAAHLNYPQGMLAGQTAVVTGSGRGNRRRGREALCEGGRQGRYFGCRRR